VDGWVVAMPIEGLRGGVDDGDGLGNRTGDSFPTQQRTEDRFSAKKTGDNLTRKKKTANEA
jgi:hypothetical protein